MIYSEKNFLIGLFFFLLALVSTGITVYTGAYSVRNVLTILTFFLISLGEYDLSVTKDHGADTKKTV